MATRLILAATLFACLVAGCASAPSAPASKLANVIGQEQAADKAYMAGDMQSSITLYRELTREVPQESDYWYRLGNAYARLQLPDEAVNAYQEAIKRNAAHARAWHNLGVVRLRQAQAALITSANSAAKDDPVREESRQLADQLSTVGSAHDEPGLPKSADKPEAQPVAVAPAIVPVVAPVKTIAAAAMTMAPRKEDASHHVVIPVNDADEVPVEVLDGGAKVESKPVPPKSAMELVAPAVGGS